jgi:hypothetical protein
MEGIIETRFDVSDEDKTVRMGALAPALCSMDDEIQNLRVENGRLRAQREQLRAALGLAREEIMRLKASSLGSDKRLSIAETMASELMRQLEMLSRTGRR